MRAPTIDRVAAAVAGLGLIAAGLGLAEWRFERLGEYRQTWSAQEVFDVLDATWFSWAAGAAGVALTLLGLWWLIAHLPTPPPRTLRLPASNGSGRLEIDLGSIAQHLAADLEQIAPVDHVRARRVADKRDHVVRLRANVDPRADVPTLSAAVGEIRSRTEVAFPDGGVEVQVLLEQPRRSARRREPRVQ